jgi:hypothetical protein
MLSTQFKEVKTQVECSQRSSEMKKTIGTIFIICSFFSSVKDKVVYPDKLSLENLIELWMNQMTELTTLIQQKIFAISAANFLTEKKIKLKEYFDNLK